MPTDLNKALQFKDKLMTLVNLGGVDPVLEEYYKRERNYFVNNYHSSLPLFLTNCRTISDFQNQLRKIASDSGSYKKRREFIEDEFKDFLNYLEFGQLLKVNQAKISGNNISIVLRKEVFSHVKDLLNNDHYSNAVEESYKIVREKLKDITGEEKATNAFSTSNLVAIFGHQSKDDAEKDFFEGVKFLHMAIQFLRNEKSHTPASPIDPNLAIHYIVLASLAYDLISQPKS